ncbi:MAG: HD-GYP domain-containing protein, partial [Candidatus Omnitrophica bacterium]|nr:HD-GYP domain-containing protein [Candidatus Omnitrophota bacterium]
VGEGIAGRVASTKKPLIISDVLSSRESKFMECIKREGINSVICVPITLKNSVLGTLSIYDRKMGAFVEEDRSLLMNFANHLAILIDNVKTHRKIFISYINTIKSLVSAVEARDLYTRGHSEKVTWFALAIASAMNLPKNDRVMLSYCGRLHDIGKIAISDLILNKRGPLTTAEKAEIQLHPLKGVEILSNLKFIEKGLPAIRHHHERYDGTGYPDELKEKEIPLLARIIACADAFDAMISDRAYRPGMNTKEAITELRANRGKQFDPNILDVFIDLILKNNAQLTAAK